MKSFNFRGQPELGLYLSNGEEQPLLTEAGEIWDELSKLLLDIFQSWEKRTHDALTQERNCCVLTTGQGDENGC